MKEKIKKMYMAQQLSDLCKSTAEYSSNNCTEYESYTVKKKNNTKNTSTDGRTGAFL